MLKTYDTLTTLTEDTYGISTGTIDTSVTVNFIGSGAGLLTQYIMEGDFTGFAIAVYTSKMGF